MNQEYAFHSPDQIHAALGSLRSQFALTYAEDLHLLCCGGAALSARGLVSRPTNNVDVLAVIVGDELKLAGLSALRLRTRLFRRLTNMACNRICLTWPHLRPCFHEVCRKAYLGGRLPQQNPMGRV